MKAYGAYKPACLSSLGAIPVHWDEERIKTVFVESDIRSATGDEEMLSVSHITGITPRSQKNVNMFLAESNVGQKICSPGDIVINTMWAWMAALGVSTYGGIVSPSYGVYKPYISKYNSQYLDYLLRTEYYRAEYVRRSTGINSSRLRLYPDRFLDMRFVCPPIEEQNQIVRYLNWKVSQINRLINAKRRQIGLLQECLRKSIDDIMTNTEWRKARLKDVAVIYTGNSISDKSKYQSAGEAYPYISSKDISLGTGVVDYDNGMYTPFSEIDFRIAPTNSVLLCIEGGSAGKKVAIVDREVSFVNKLCCFNTMHFNPQFLYFYMKSSQFFSEFKKNMTGLIGGVSKAALRQTSIPFPEIEAQALAVEDIDVKYRSIQNVISEITKKISLLHEYRTRLISDVVTGKIDVRGVAVPEHEAVEENTGEMDEIDLMESEV